MRVDLNCDMGESFGIYKIGLDEEAVKHISSASIACGFHAGDPQVMARTVDLAVAHGVAVGAHPSYPDLIGFGRRKMEVEPQQLKNYIIYQVGALHAFVRAGGTRLQHVKPHGALYNTAAADISTARTIAGAVASIDENLILMGPANSEMERAAREAGLRYAREVFADRAYNRDGTLVDRSRPHSVITDSAEVAERMVELISTGRITSIDGASFRAKADSICVHGDTPGAIEHMIKLRRSLQAAGVKIMPVGDFI